MAQPIKGGYYIKARCIQDSAIAHAPPHVREIWDWLLKEANHADNGVCRRGQCVRTYRDIQEGLAWYVGYRKNTYKKHQCENAMKWLRKAEMIATTKTTRGIVVTICNYGRYQDPSNYECYTSTDTNATMVLQPPATINKNEKNGRKKEGNYFNADTLAGSAMTEYEYQIREALLRHHGDRVETLRADTVDKLIRNLGSDIYSGVSVPMEIHRAAIWEDSNPTRRKTAKGLPKFLTTWMENAQNGPRRGGGGGSVYDKNRDLLDQWERENNERDNYDK